MKKLLIGCLLLGFSQLASAASVSTDPGTVTKLQLGSTGHLFMTTTAPKINPALCVSTTYFLDTTFPSFNRYYAMLLTAKATGDLVVLRIDDTTCVSGYPKIQGIEQRLQP